MHVDHLKLFLMFDYSIVKNVYMLQTERRGMCYKKRNFSHIHYSKERPLFLFLQQFIF